MNFFQAQDAARRSTSRLVVLFGLAIVVLVVVSYLLVSAVLWMYRHEVPSLYHATVSSTQNWEFFSIAIAVVLTLLITGSLYQILVLAGGGYVVPVVSNLLVFWVLWMYRHEVFSVYRTTVPWAQSWELFITTSGVILALIIAGSLYKLLVLSGGGRVVAEALGGEALSPDSKDPLQRRTLNVVEEMAIASGTPVPQVYVLPESGINAFAAGYSPSDAVIGLTRGAMKSLSRTELQGVTAHEFSHILNGDMRLNMRVTGLLHGILLISLFGRMLMRARGRKAGAVVFAGLGLFIAGWAGFFFGSLIKAGISRQREFLADASAVQFTRDPQGIAGALKRIGGYPEQSIVAEPAAEQISHSFFAQVFARSRFSFATHPPLKERIRRIDPGWDGQFPSPGKPTADADSDPGEPAAPVTPVTASIAATAALALLNEAGQMDVARLGYAKGLIDTLPDHLLEGVRDPYSARAIIYALIVAQSDRQWHEAQLAHLKEHGDQGIHDLTLDFLRVVPGLKQTDRLPLVDLALPALRSMSLAQFTRFRQNLVKLVSIDSDIQVFEWALHRILIHHLDSAFVRPSARTRTMKSLQQLSGPCLTVLSFLAHSGAATPEAANSALKEALDSAGLSGVDRQALTAKLASFDELGQALDALAGLKPTAKQGFLQACVACVVADDQVVVEEMELLRAFADILDCPVPPVVLGQNPLTG